MDIPDLGNSRGLEWILKRFELRYIFTAVVLLLRSLYLAHENRSRCTFILLCCCFENRTQATRHNGGASCHEAWVRHNNRNAVDPMKMKIIVAWWTKPTSPIHRQ